MPFIELQTVDSTNNYALSRVHAGLAQHGMAFFAHEQVAGKGQRGRVWTTEKDANIILSLLVKPTGLAHLQPFRLSACAALAARDFFSRYAGAETRIKWPNDLYWQDRKAGGILIENVIGAQTETAAAIPVPSPAWQWSVIGIGININQTVFPGELQNPVSLKQITGKSFDPVELAKELCAVLDHHYRQLTDRGFDAIYKGYLDQLYKRHKPIKLKKGSRVFEATLETITPSGQLMVRHAIDEFFDFGEVEWLV